METSKYLSHPNMVVIQGVVKVSIFVATTSPPMIEGFVSTKRQLSMTIQESWGTAHCHHFPLLVQCLIDLLCPMTNVKLDLTFSLYLYTPLSLSISLTFITHTKETHTIYPQMLSDGGGCSGDDVNNLNTNHHNLGRVSRRSTTLSSSSSSSTTTSSNHSPFSPSLNTTRTMEEVWKDINLSTTNHPAAAGTKGYRGFILQDFLAKPFSTNDINTPTTLSSPPTPPPPPPVSQPPMLLNLNSGPDQMNFLVDDPTRINVCPLDVPFDHVLGSSNSSSGLLGQNIGGMRMLPATDKVGGGERRHKRMIKNRESAARSRARKQAYMNELENEVERLKEENAKLKRQQQQLQVAPAAQMTKKGGLQRTSTAPF